MNAKIRYWIMAAIVCVFVIASIGPARAEFETEAGWNEQLFPSFIIATATVRLPDDASENDDDTVDVEDQDAEDHGADSSEYEADEDTDESDDEQTLGDPQGLLGVTIEAPDDDTTVTVTVACDAIMAPSAFTGVLATGGESYTVLPKIKYKYDVLARQSQPGPITVTFTVEVGDEAPEEMSQTLILRSINDCPFMVVEGDEMTDVCFMFAAYVNEQHPYVDKLLREALDTGVVDSFTGYQTNDKAEVYRQVYALWHALTERDVRYSDITTSSAESDSVYSQHVRMIDESINNAQANCVDGSVLLASLLRKVGIEPILVMVPGHCYLAFALDPAGEEIAGLETTLIGAVLDGEPADIEGVEAAVDEDWTTEDSWRTFTAALAMGATSLEENAEHFEAESDHDYRLIPVAAARRIGILPIAFQSGNEFVAAPGYGDDFETDEDDE